MTHSDVYPNGPTQEHRLEFEKVAAGISQLVDHLKQIKDVNDQFDHRSALTGQGAGFDVGRVWRVDAHLVSANGCLVDALVVAEGLMRSWPAAVETTED